MALVKGNKIRSLSWPRLTGQAPQVPKVDPHAQARALMARLKPWVALDVLSKGMGSDRAWYCVWFRLIIGQELAEAYYTDEAQAAFTDAFSALSSTRFRFNDSGHRRWRATAMETHLVMQALEATDRLVEVTTMKEKMTVQPNLEAAMRGSIEAFAEKFDIPQ